MDQHVLKTGKGKSRLVKCKYCNHPLPNTTSRWASHLNRCDMAPESFNFEPKRQRITIARIDRGNSSLLIENQIASTKSVQSGKPDWIDHLTDKEKLQLDKAYAEIFFSTGVPFRFADSPALSKFIRMIRPAYNPPTGKVVANSLLDNAHREMQKCVASFMNDQPIVSIVSDGWTSMRNDHMVNFVAVFPQKISKPVFLKAIHTNETQQTGVNIAAELEKVIISLGVSKVGSIVTDNAACMKSAWQILESKFPGIICNGCAAHAINLLVKDVCKLATYEETLDRTRNITAFVKDQVALSKRFERIQDNLQRDGELPNKRHLSSVVLTRWYTHYNCLLGVLENRKVLTQLINTTLFTDLKTTASSRGKKMEFSRTVLDSDYWLSLESLELILRPTCKVIGQLESNSCSLSDVYRCFLELNRHWDQNRDLAQLLQERWKFLRTDSMSFAYYLDPKTQAGEGMFEDDLYDNSRLLQEFIIQKKNICGDIGLVQQEMASFVESMKNPSEKAKFFIDQCVTPMAYWQQVGSTKFPILFQVARLVFSVSTSQAASERVWSIYDFILTKRRNRLSPEKVTKLVQLYMNAELSSRGSVVNVMMGEESDAGGSDSDTG